MARAAIERAQRLSASQTWSRPDLALAAAREQCSTPFGVTDLVTRRAGNLERRGDGVLNAFRRHRLGHPYRDAAAGLREQCSTPFGVTDLVTSWTSFSVWFATCAQRLSASQTWSRLAPSNLQSLCACAQRLSASQTWSLGKDELVEDAADVLNAFRRHRLGHPTRPCRRTRRGRCSTPFGVTDLVTRGRDRGRYRGRGAQRLSASQTWSPAQGQLGILMNEECSTPFGVTDLVTGGQATPAERVLNAFRRHRLGHVGRCRWRRACSTPFGVTDLVTGSDALIGSCARRQCAQRLSASQTWSPPAPIPLVDKDLRTWFSTMPHPTPGRGRTSFHRAPGRDRK